MSVNLELRAAKIRTRKGQFGDAQFRMLLSTTSLDTIPHCIDTPPSPASISSLRSTHSPVAQTPLAVRVRLRSTDLVTRESQRTMTNPDVLVAQARLWT